MKKIAALILSITMLATMLVGCTTDNTDSTNDASKTSEDTQDTNATDEPAKEVTITTASMFGGTDPHAKPYNAINEQFMLDNAGVTIEDESRVIDEAWRASIINDYNADNAPDVLYYVHHADGQAIVDTGKVVDVKTIQAEYPEYAANIDANAMKTLETKDGNAYCVPMKGYWEGIFINQTLFDENSVPVPTNWEEMVFAIETFKSKDIVPFSLALGHIPHFFIEHMFMTFGGVEALRERPTTEDEIPDSWIKGINLLKELYDMGAFPADTNSTTEEVVNLMFQEGKSAMLVTGSWFPGQVALESEDGSLITQDEVKLIPFPAQKDITGTNGVVAGWSGGFYISKDAWEDPDKRDLVVDLVMAHTSADGIAQYCGPELGGVPADPSVVAAGTDPLVIAGNDFWSANRENSADPACDHMNADPKNILYQGLPKVCVGDMTAEELLKSVIEKGAYTK